MTTAAAPPAPLRPEPILEPDLPIVDAHHHLWDRRRHRRRGRAFYCADGEPALRPVSETEWRPYIETCIEAFGPARSMFESNCPVDLGSGGYAIPWNAFRRTARDFTLEEKARLFSETARDIDRRPPDVTCTTLN